jgi:hypothetical protein
VTELRLNEKSASAVTNPLKARKIPRISSLRSAEISNKGGRGSTGWEWVVFLPAGAFDLPVDATGLPTGLAADFAPRSSFLGAGGLLFPFFGAGFTKGNLNGMELGSQESKLSGGKT